MTLTDCTISGNETGTSSANAPFFPKTGARGAGILASQGTLTLVHCTISDNRTGPIGGSGCFGEGGGLFVRFANMVFVSNSIIAGNFGQSGTENVDAESGAVTGVTNVLTGDPLLTPLANYGGPTETMVPLPGSSAILGAVSYTHLTLPTIPLV